MILFDVNLGQLNPGERCRIKELKQYTSIRRRLRDMGFVPGAEAVCVFSAPSGSPVAFYLMGTVVALRKDECSRILVERCA